MGKRGPKPAAKAAKPAPPTLKAQGSTRTKRTPTSAVDGAAGKDTYEPEKIMAQRLAKGITQFQVKWVGWESKHNIWEPIEHLAGCEDIELKPGSSLFSHGQVILTSNWQLTVSFKK